MAFVSLEFHGEWPEMEDAIFRYQISVKLCPKVRQEYL